MKKFGLVHLSLILGILSFIHLFGMEKAILAVVIGALALKEESDGKKLAWIGIILGLVYLLIIALILIFKFPKLISILEKIK
jgi:hypothetical protein